jgi:uncharacterized protein (TIGR03437 family)
MFARFAFLGLFGIVLGLGQQPGPNLSVDVNAGRHPISPDIYGVNFYWDLGTSGDPKAAAYLEAASDIRATARRWGGNSTSTYHWKLDVDDLDNDWFYEVLPSAGVNAANLPNGSTFNQFADRARMSGGKIVATVPVLGWLPRARSEMCSFDIRKYGSQCKIDPYAQYHTAKCGNGIAYDTACGDPNVADGKAPRNPVYIKNDPTDVYAQTDETLQAGWVRYAISRYGRAAQGGVAIWSLDNEPIWWDNTHRDIHPDPYTYDELLALDTRYAAAIKQADPTALVSGPVGDNWASLFFSKKDIVAGQARGNYWSNPVDRNAHGGMALLPWYLQQMQSYEQQHGVRLLDYLDQHAYLAPANVAFANAGDAATQALRLQSTRVFWDPTYAVTSDYWIRDVDHNGAPVAPQFIPRLRDIVAQNYPGTKIALTEYNWGALDNINGALAQADLLGIFGREGLDLATLWGPPKPTDPGAFAFKVYRNYDGIGGSFGDTSVQAFSDDQSQLSVYAAIRSDLNLTLMVINKTSSDLSGIVSLANFAAGGAAKTWRYSPANLNAIMPQPDVAVSGNGINTMFPGNSITLLVIPPATLPFERPVVTAVTSAASYGSAVAPGQMVVVWGHHLGPEQLVPSRLDRNGLVSSVAGGVRILFDGVPAPLVYATASQCSAVMPYFGASRAATHVQVEYQGVRSEPFEVAVGATAPGLFTADNSGKGQGAILNEDGATPNSAGNPARLGSIVVLWGTGEGITDPPGVDGRPAVDVLPKPIAPVSVAIGGQPAVVEYIGAAPGLMPGIFQINARMSKDVAPGDRVAVQVKVGSVTSQDGVTLAVR